MASTTTIARSASPSITPRKPIAHRWHEALRNGDGWDTAYTTAIQVLNAMARANWTWDDVVATWEDTQLYQDAYLTRSDNGRRKGATTAFEAFRSDWLDAVEYVDPTKPITDPIGAYAAILKIRHAADRHHWGGRTGLRDHIVLNALLNIADTLGTVNPQVSTRTLCEDTPYRNQQVVARALQSLAASGWITPDRHGLKRTDATRYRLRSEVGSQSDRTLPPTPVGTSVLPVTPSDGPDGVRLAVVLTPHQQAVYAALGAAPQSRNQISRLSRVSRPTVSKALPDLALAGLARQVTDPDGVVLGWAVGDTTPDKVMFERGAGEKVDARKERHDKQRMRWQDHVEGRLEDRAKAMERASELRRQRDAEALRSLAARPPKPEPKWRVDAKPHDARVREEHERSRRDVRQGRQPQD